MKNALIITLDSDQKPHIYLGIPEGVEIDYEKWPREQANFIMLLEGVALMAQAMHDNGYQNWEESIKAANRHLKRAKDDNSFSHGYFDN